MDISFKGFQNTAITKVAGQSSSGLIKMKAYRFATYLTNDANGKHFDDFYKALDKTEQASAWKYVPKGFQENQLIFDVSKFELDDRDIQPNQQTFVKEEELKDICEQLKKDFDFILVDCPAGIEQGFQNAVAGASEAIVVTTPEMSAVRDADRIIGLLEAKEEIKSYKLLLNRVRPNLIKSNDMMSVEDVVEILSADLVGIIPEDTGIITSTNKGEPIVNEENSLAGKAYRNVARRIMGEEVPFLDLEEETSFMHKVKKFFSHLVGKEK